MVIKKTACLLIALAIVGVLTGGRAIAGQWVVGSVSIRNDAGQNVYGERLAVFLVKTSNPVSAQHCLQETHHQRRIDCINNCHLDFFKQFQARQRESGYLVDQTVTSETGNFVFFEPSAGRYFVLVKFPSMIDGYKVAWQEPVAVTPNRISVVTLNDDNLVLPRNRRR
jgi:hypothetical protein